MNRTTQDWVDHFRWNGSVAMRIPWHLGPDLSDEERAAIAHSIQVFQLGENSEGRHLMRYAKQWAEHTGDTLYPEAIRMLIVEEQRHAGVLARFMEINGIARITHRCSDGIFRRARNLLGRQIQPRGNRARRVPNRATGAHPSPTLGIRHPGDALHSPPALLSDHHGSWIVASDRIAPRRSVAPAVRLAMPQGIRARPRRDGTAGNLASEHTARPRERGDAEDQSSRVRFQYDRHSF